MPRKKAEPVSSASADRPFEVTNEPTEGSLIDPPPEFQLSSGPDDPPAAAQSSPARTGKKPGRKPGQKNATKAGTVEPAAVPPPDPALVSTCAFGVLALTGMAERGLGFSDPGDEWRAVMAQLSARWLQQLEGDWLKTHPIEAQMLLHLGMWIVPNSLAIGAAYVKRKVKQRNEQRSDAHLRTETNRENKVDAPAAPVM